MRKSPRKNKHRTMQPLVLALCVLLLPTTLRAEGASAAELLAKMRAVFGPETDCYAHLTVSRAGDRGRPAGEFIYLRSDARRSGLLYQVFPADVLGYAFLYVAKDLMAYNPACLCSQAAEAEALVRRFGVSFAELDPRSLGGLAVREEARTGFLDGQAVFVIGLQSEAPGETLDVYLSASTLLPLRRQTRDASGKITRTVDYPGYYEAGGCYIPRRMTIAAPGVPRLAVTVDDLSLRPLPDFVFTRSYLEELSPAE